MTVGDAPSGVSRTALGVAMIRAEESRRPDRLFDDPHAGAFLEAAPGAFEVEERAAAEPGSDVATWGTAFWAHAVVRTRFFDDWLLDAAHRGTRQVVLLAAGLDTRSYRLAWPDGVRLFELDLPEMFSFKDAVLDAQRAVPRCERVPVAVDLRKEWTRPLTAAGLDPSDRTAWLVEGLFIYLSADEAAGLLTSVGRLSIVGSRLAFEYESLGTDAMRAQARSSPVMAQYSAMWKGGLPDPYAWLAGHGWEPERHQRADVAAGYGREVPSASDGGFITAVRID